jgi:acyl phosphate:glycerol-3-phosphate acyltransferase
VIFRINGGLFMRIGIALFIGYIFGCLQTPYLIVKFVKRVDIREYGSKNAGASNATRILGFKFGILIGIVDILKAVAAVLLTNYLYNGDLTAMFTAGTACMIGHIYPVFLRFKGGKGVATTIGTLLAINYPLGLAAILVLLIITIITNYVALGSLTLYVLLPVALYYLRYSWSVIAFGIFMGALGIYKHRGNISRVLSGTENVIFKR